MKFSFIPGKDVVIACHAEEQRVNRRLDIRPLMCERVTKCPSRVTMMAPDDGDDDEEEENSCRFVGPEPTYIA
jgi:hypothetical protein